MSRPRRGSAPATEVTRDPNERERVRRDFELALAAECSATKPLRGDLRIPEPWHGRCTSPRESIDLLRRHLEWIRGKAGGPTQVWNSVATFIDRLERAVEQLEHAWRVELLAHGQEPLHADRRLVDGEVGTGIMVESDAGLVDICDLDKGSLVAWLRSVDAVNVVCVLLGHGRSTPLAPRIERRQTPSGWIFFGLEEAESSEGGVP